MYGFPEFTRDDVADADLVANPGCYPTAALFGLAPLARAGLIGDVVIDAKSGVSGAGRAATSTTTSSPPTRTSRRTRSRATGTRPRSSRSWARSATTSITFMPHLLPLAQGELVSCYVTPSASWGRANWASSIDDVYAREPFVELRSGPVGVLEVRDSNFCRISLHHDPRTGRIIVFAVIDNLWKGAASQAVQNLNLMFGRPESEALCEPLAGSPGARHRQPR